MRLVLALIVLLVLPAVADARRVTVRIHPLHDHGVSSLPIDERFRVSVPDGCGVRLWGRVYDRDDRVEKSPLKRRFRIDDRAVYLHGRARRCASATAARVLRSARLDRTRRPCDASGVMRTENDQVRVYEEHERLWACARENRFRLDLGASPRGNDCGGGDFCNVELPVVAGPFVAYAYEYAGRRDSSSRVYVRDARTGREVHSVQSGNDCDPQNEAGPVKSLVLTATGAPAWIVTDCTYKAYEVRTLAGVVSAGAGIDPGSLKLARDTITWVQDGAPRQATVGATALASAAKARRITVRIHPADDQIFFSPVPLEERFRVTLPGTGRVTRHPHGERRWVDGRCSLRLWGVAYKDDNVEASPRKRRFRIGERTVYLHGEARGCPAGTVARIMRSAGLDRSRRPCEAGGKTAAENEHVRAYADRKRLVFCSRETRHRLDAGPFAGGNGCGLEHCAVDLPAVGGPFAAYLSEFSGRSGWSGTIRVHDARTGHQLREIVAGGPCGAGVHALVLSAGGTPVWIVQDECAPQTKTYELRTEAGVVSAGPGIDPGSLKLAGDTITWVQDGAPRQSRIDSPRIARAMTSFWISLVPS